jgi:rhodanese-related sulfurtransferase
MINFKNILNLFYNNLKNNDMILVEKINNKEQTHILNKYRYIIDVRTEEEFNENHLLGAINIPLNEIKKNLDNYRLSKNSKILIYCKSGRRAKLA